MGNCNWSYRSDGTKVQRSGGGAFSGLPNESDYRLKKMPALQGNSGDIQRATEIREQKLRALARYTIANFSDGRQSGLYAIARQGNDAIKSDINTFANRSGNASLVSQKINDRVKSYQDIAARCQRFNKIVSHDNASYWLKIGNDNFGSRKLQLIVDGKTEDMFGMSMKKLID